jgi:hypothetical protein
VLPTWTSLGPTPQYNDPTMASGTETEGDKDVAGNVAGKVTALAYDYRGLASPQQGACWLFAGSAGGGIYRTAAAITGRTTATPPTWELVSPGPGEVKLANGDAVPIERTAGINRIGCIATSTAGGQPDVVYAGTGDPVEGAGAGILRSLLGGRAGSWRLVGTQFAGMAVVSILIDPTDAQGNTLYAAVRPADGPSNKVTDGGIWKSRDAGLTWSQLTDFPGADALGSPKVPVILPEDLNYVRVKKADSKDYFYRLVVSVSPGRAWQDGAFNRNNTGVWTSDDGGQTWVRRPTGIITNVDVQRIKIAVSHPSIASGKADIMYAVATRKEIPVLGQNGQPVIGADGDPKVNGGDIAAVMRSTDGGANWVPMLDTTSLTALRKMVKGKTSSKLVIATSDEDANILFVGAVDMAVCRNALARKPTWAQLDGFGDKQPWPTHADHHAFLVPQLQGGNFAYDGNDGGVWMVRPGGKYGGTWTNMNGTTLNTIQVDGVAAYKYANFSVYVEASQDNGLARKQDNVGGQRWDKTYFPIGDGGPILFTKDGAAYASRYGSPRQILFSKEGSTAKTWKHLSQQTNGNTDANGFPQDANGKSLMTSVPDFPALALNPSGDLLLGSEKGVWLRSGRKWQSLKGDGKLQDGWAVTALAAPTNATIYAAKENGALYRRGFWQWQLLQESGDFGRRLSKPSVIHSREVNPGGRVVPAGRVVCDGVAKDLGVGRQTTFDLDPVLLVVGDLVRRRVGGFVVLVQRDGPADDVPRRVAVNPDAVLAVRLDLVVVDDVVLRTIDLDAAYRILVDVVPVDERVPGAPGFGVLLADHVGLAATVQQDTGVFVRLLLTALPTDDVADDDVPACPRGDVDAVLVPDERVVFDCDLAGTLQPNAVARKKLNCQALNLASAGRRREHQPVGNVHARIRVEDDIVPILRDDGHLAPDDRQGRLEVDFVVTRVDNRELEGDVTQPIPGVGLAEYPAERAGDELILVRRHHKALRRLEFELEIHLQRHVRRRHPVLQRLKDRARPGGAVGLVATEQEGVAELGQQGAQHG